MSDVKKHHRQKDLLAYQQGFLSDAERTELEAHMKDCADCQETLKDVQRFLPALQQALAPPKVSAEVLLARAKAQLEEQKAKRRMFWFGVPAGGLALAAGVAAVVLLVQRPGGGVGPGTMAQVGADAGESEQLVDSPHPPKAYLDGGADGGAAPDAK